MNKKNISQSNQKYCAAMYLRLSREDGDFDGAPKTESNSISNQRELIRSYINSSPDIELYDVYIDDGYTGSNFNRPDFQRMTTDIEAGKVNCVIVKDLSRFGRDYIEVGRYLQKIYPALKVRFIAIGDDYDSLQSSLTDSTIIVPVKNFINESYCRDISIKTRTAKSVKYSNGECVAAFVVYGYKKSETDKNRLVVDEYPAQIVKNIYRWKILGYSADAIAKQLDSLGILSPAEYKKSQGLKYRCYFSKDNPKWSSKAVHRILTNPVYLGHLIQGKTECISYKVKKIVEKPEDKWVCVENTHEAIISEAEFEIVQNLLKTDVRRSPKDSELDIFSGLLFCGTCKERMIRRIRKKEETTRVSYVCSTYNRVDGCTSHEISYDTLMYIVGETVLQYIQVFLERESIFERLRTSEIDMKAVALFDQETMRLEEKRNEQIVYRTQLAEELQRGVLTIEEFQRLTDLFDVQIESLNKKIEAQRKIIRNMFIKGVASIQQLNVMRQTLEVGKLDRYSLCFLVREITILENGRIHISFYFADQFLIMKDVIEGIYGKGQGKKELTYA